jgi:hypothetical protein
MYKNHVGGRGGGEVSHNKPIGCGASGAYAPGPDDEERRKYEGNSISKLQIQVATYVFELSLGNCHR